jgi:hypothetical protein
MQLTHSLMKKKRKAFFILPTVKLSRNVDAAAAASMSYI